MTQWKRISASSGRMNVWGSGCTRYSRSDFGKPDLQCLVLRKRQVDDLADPELDPAADD
jgi:hypothetical protein